jgi:hypothetical protein
LVPKFHGCIVVAAGLVLLLFLLSCFFYIALRQSSDLDSTPSSATTNEPPQPQPVLTSAYWMATLNGLPPGASLFGTIDPTANNPAGSFNLDDVWMQSLVRLFVSGEAANQLAPENLGRIQIARLALGYYEESKSKDARVVVHLTGIDLDGHKRIADFVRQSAGETVQVEELDKKMGANGPVCISSPRLPIALKILDDSHAYLVASLSRDAKASQPRKLLDPLPAAGIGAGYNPPWVKNALSTNPHGLGFFMGEIPAEWRLFLKEALKLRECPRTFVCHFSPEAPPSKEGRGIALDLTLNVEKAGADRLLRDDLEKWRPRALNTLQTWFPILKSDRQGSALLGQILNSMRWNADNGSVRTQVRISGPTWKALGEALARVSKTYAEGRK